MKALEGINSRASKRPQLFTVERFSELLARTTSEPTRSLMGSFWHEREIVLMAGQTGIGKSAVALDVANRIAAGNQAHQMHGFEVNTEPQKVLYMDFENDPEEQKQRTEGVTLHPNLWRADICADYASANPTAAEILDGIVELIRPGGAVENCRVVIIDNVSYLFDGAGRDMHEETTQLFKALNQLRKQHGVAFMVVAHRNKGDNAAITTNAVAGSSSMTRFVQAAFGMAQWVDDASRLYFRQIKAGRTRPMKWTKDNVLTGQLSTRSGMLRVETSSEVWDESALISGEGKSNAAKVREMLADDPTRTGSSIANELGTTSQNINKLIRAHNLRTDGEGPAQLEKMPF